MHRTLLFAALGLALFAACAEPPGFRGSPDVRADAATDAPSETSTACAPGVRRCDPSQPDVPQQCAPDGAGWVASGPACTAQPGSTCSAGVCTDPCAEAATHLTNVGCEFWAVTAVNAQLGLYGGTFPFAIVVANPQSYPVTVHIDGGALDASMPRMVEPHGLQVIQLPWVQELAQLTTPDADPNDAASVLLPGGAYRVRASAPVAVYQFNPLTYQPQPGTCADPAECYSYTNDASLLLPTTALTRRYTALTYERGSPFVAIVGTSDAGSTTVTVTLSDDTVRGYRVTAAAARSRQTYTLAAGDVVQLVGVDDLTGTVIEASQPVAVFTGNSCTLVPRDESACDHLEEQALPEETWDSHYAVTALADRPGAPSRVRVLAQRDGTTVRFEPASVHAPVTLAARGFVELEATVDFVVTASAPVLVAQYMVGQDATGETSPLEQGDPMMVFEVPIAQHRTSYDFFVPGTYSRNFVNIVGATGVAPLLDGAAPSVAGAPIGASGLSVWRLPIPPGAHHLTAPDGTSTYGLKVYGVASYTSYGYPGGLDLASINPG